MHFWHLFPLASLLQNRKIWLKLVGLKLLILIFGWFLLVQGILDCGIGEVSEVPLTFISLPGAHHALDFPALIIYDVSHESLLHFYRLLSTCTNLARVSLRPPFRISWKRGKNPLFQSPVQLGCR